MFPRKSLMLVNQNISDDQVLNIISKIKDEKITSFYAHRSKMSYTTQEALFNSIVNCESLEKIILCESNPFQFGNIIDPKVTIKHVYQLVCMSNLKELTVLMEMGDQAPPMCIKIKTNNAERELKWKVGKFAYSHLTYDQDNIITHLKFLLNATPMQKFKFLNKYKIESEFPSLEKLCLFKLKNSPQIDASKLHEDLSEKLIRMKLL